VTVAVADRVAVLRACDAILQAPFLLALAILVVNDRVLKSWWGNAATGKLSDVAGLVFFPLLCAALADVVLRVAGRGGVRRRGFVTAIAVTGVTFGLVKLFPAAAEAYSYGLGVAQWPIESARAAAASAPAPGISPVWVLADVTDLLTLPALWLAWRAGRDVFAEPT